LNQSPTQNPAQGIKLLTITDPASGQVVGDRIRHCTTGRDRRVGLLKDTALEAGTGILLEPCEGVHTFGMKFPIDIVFLNRKRKIVALHRSVPARRLRLSLRAHATLELPAGSIDRLGLQAEQPLKITPA
jgi:uncharacterized membrane protein (UPF0127 family)